MSDNRQSLSDLAALTGATPPAPTPEPTQSEASTSDPSETEAPAALRQAWSVSVVPCGNPEGWAKLKKRLRACSVSLLKATIPR